MGKMSIYKDFKIPLMDFVERADEIPNLIGLILFGSAVTGDVSKKSDIDLLLITKSDHNPELGEESNIAHSIASNISKKYDMSHPFSLTFYNIEEKDIEPDFLWEVSKEGIVIWARTDSVLEKYLKESLKPKLICSYSLKGVEQKDKRGLIRNLYESKSKLINKKEKIAPGVLILDAKKEPFIIKIFNKYKVREYTIKKIWTS